MHLHPTVRELLKCCAAMCGRMSKNQLPLLEMRSQQFICSRRHVFLFLNCLRFNLRACPVCDLGLNYRSKTDKLRLLE